MNKKQHTFFGIILWLFFIVYFFMNYHYPIERTAIVLIVSFFFCYIGSMFPDLDSKNSGIFRKMQTTAALVLLIIYFILFGKYFTNTVYVILASIIAVFVSVILMRFLVPRHRGFVHSLRTGLVYGFFSMIISFALLSEIYISVLIAFFAFLSFMSHLALDTAFKF